MVRRQMKSLVKRRSVREVVTECPNKVVMVQQVRNGR